MYQMADSKYNAGKLLYNKVVSNKLKRGENFREILRKRCCEQIHKKRNELFDRQRLGLNDGDEINQDAILHIMRKEFNDMSIMLNNNSESLWGSEQDSILDDNIIKIEEEMNEIKEHSSILTEYEEIQQYDDDFINQCIDNFFKDEVICPICQTVPIQESLEGLICQYCKSKYPPKSTIRGLAIAIEQGLNIHNSNCLQQASFVLLPENDTITLYLICDTCNKFVSIM